MSNQHVLMPVHARSHVWYRQTPVHAADLRHGDVAFQRENSCGACTVLENRYYRQGDRYVIFACCGGQHYQPDMEVVVAAPRLSAGSLDVATVRHPTCRCRWS